MKKIIQESALTVGAIWLIFAGLYTFIPSVRFSLWFDVCFGLFGLIGPAVYVFTNVTSHLRQQRAAAKGIGLSCYLPAFCYVGGLADYKDRFITAKYATFLNSKEHIWIYECDETLASPSYRKDFWEHIKRTMGRIPKTSIRAIGIIEQAGAKVTDSHIASSAKDMSQHFTVGQLFRYKKEQLSFASYLLVAYDLGGVTRTASFGIPHASRAPAPITFIGPLSSDELSRLAKSAGIRCTNIEIDSKDAPAARNCKLIAHELLRWRAL